MPAWKALLLVLVGGLILAAGVFTFIPSTRPAPIKRLFWKAAGLKPAESPEDAMDRFRRALEKRDYEAAATLYCAGDYKEWLAKGHSDARDLAEAVDNLQHAVKKHGVKSDEGDLLIYMLDPFPADFKIVSVSKVDDKNATATISWYDALTRFTGQNFFTAKESLGIDNKTWNCLLPGIVTGTPVVLQLIKDADDTWKVVMPVQSGDRHMRDCIYHLQKNGSNVRNGLVNLKNDVKNSAPTKDKFVEELKRYLRESK